MIFSLGFTKIQLLRRCGNLKVLSQEDALKQESVGAANSQRFFVCVPRAGFEPATHPLAKREALSIELPWEQKQIYVL